MTGHDAFFDEFGALTDEELVAFLPRMETRRVNVVTSPGLRPSFKYLLVDAVSKPPDHEPVFYEWQPAPGPTKEI